VFDLDGTLVDTADDVRDLINPLMRQVGHADLTRTDVIACFGLGAQRFVQRALARTEGPPVTDETRAALTQAFVAHYAIAPPVHSRAYPGAAACLAACRAAGYRMAICTNKPQAAAQTLLDHMDLSNWFDGVTGGDTLPCRKPDPAHLLDAVARAGGAPSRAIMVGDSETDAATGIAAKVPVILMAGGYHHTPLADLGANRILRSFADLPAALADLDPAIGSTEYRSSTP
jgi:phosphoglycolate phosphatase